jgi:hypothetical protein
MTYGEVVLMANTEGLQKTLEHIKEHPKEWDQHRWHMCFAGIALRLLRGAVIEPGDVCTCCDVLKVDGETLRSWEISDLAQEALELTDQQAAQLFNGRHRLDALTSLVAEFTAEAPVPA